MVAMDGGVTGRVRVWLLGTVFASGMAVMIVEMTAVRAMQPFFGSTTYVWTNVIAVVLAALAVGYAVGGRLADRFPSTTLLYGLLGVGGGVLLVSAWLVTPVSRLFLQDGIDLEGAVTVLLRGSLGASLILFAPPLLLLGMIAPITIRLLARGGVGRAAGSVFAVSTVGSILGTYLPALVLVPRIGSRGSILVGDESGFRPCSRWWWDCMARPPLCGAGSRRGEGHRLWSKADRPRSCARWSRPIST
jgi:MFS family permease